jgi:type IV secretion system protein TrbL
MVFVGLFGIAILLAGAYIAMVLVCALVEMYVVVAASMLLLGFGGSRWTREYATKVLTYAISVGVKLMLMQLLIGIGQNFLNSFVTAYTTFSVENVAPILVALVVLCGLVRSVPNIAQSIISGAHIHTGGGLGAAMGMAGQGMRMATIATAATMGGAGVVAGAAKLAAAQGMSTPPATGGGGLGLGSSVMKGVNFGGRMAANIARSATSDVKAGMKGERSPYTNMAQRMTRTMSTQAATLSNVDDDKKKKPQKNA